MPSFWVYGQSAPCRIPAVEALVKAVPATQELVVLQEACQLPELKMIQLGTNRSLLSAA